jgi:uncharacterized protein YndB with AHSA1/START domain
MVNISSTEDAVIGDVEIAASPEAVFAAITDSEQLKQWWGDGQNYKVDRWDGDVRVGGRYRSIGIGRSGDPFEVSGEYLTVEPPRLLVYTWEASWTAAVPASVVRWELNPSAGGTHLRVTHSGFSQHPQMIQMYSNGWPGVLGWLKGFAERKAVAQP